MESETAWVWFKVKARSSSRLASSALARASESWPSACSATASNGREIDHIEQIAGMDEGAVAELDRRDEAADAGADLHLLDRLEASGEFVPIGDGSLHRLRDRDRWRRGAAACCGGLSPQPDSATASPGSAA